MKILAICADIYPQKLGGAEVHFVEVLKRITPKVESVIVLVGPSLPYFPGFPNNVVFKTVAYPHFQNLNWLLFSIFAIPEALKYDFDLIWAKQEYLAWVAILVKLLKRRPVYVTCQNPNLAIEEWTTNDILLKCLQQGFASIFTKFLMFPLRFTDEIAAVSQYSANLAKKYGAKDVVIIPNGVDLKKFS